MRRETTQAARAAQRKDSSRPARLLVGGVYGLAIGLALALAIVGGLLPIAVDYPAGPLAFHGLLATVGALIGAVLTLLRNG